MNAIARANLDSTGVVDPLFSGTNFNGFAGLAVGGGYVYWTAAQAIGRATVDGCAANAAFIPVTGPASLDPVDVAVDGSHVYWTSGGTAIGRANLDGTGVNESFLAGSQPVTVAVDASHVYWANDNAGVYSIGRANLDGTAPDASFISLSGTAGRLAVDAGHIYWVASHAIGRANLDGTGKNEAFIPATTPAAITALAVDATYVYWSHDLDAIARATLAGTGVTSDFITSMNGLSGIAVDALGPGAEFCAAPSAVSFVARSVGSGPSAPQTVTITNSGDAPLNVSGVTLEGADSSQFVVGTDTCSGASVAAGGGTCLVSVSFDPTSNGPQSAILHFTHDASDRPTDVTLAGTGTPAAVQDTLTVTKAGSGSGAVTSQPAGIDCGDTCSHSFDPGTQVTLTATAASLSTFSGWSGAGCSGATTCVVALSGDGSVIATFTAESVQPQNTTPPAISGQPKRGQLLSCSTGVWTNQPTSFSYQWSRDGTPIVGASTGTYKVQTDDEGLTLTCTVTASNGGAAGTSATSAGLAVQVPFVPRCPRATGRLSGRTLGLAKLGMTRAQAHHAYTHSSNRGKRYEDFFCLTPRGVRVGYASPALLKTLSHSERRKLTGRVVWASTVYAYYAVRGVRPGATVIAASHSLKLTRPFRIGLNTWYLAPNGSSTAVLKVRRGIVEEIGIGDKSLTNGRKAQIVFLNSFS